MTTQRPEHRALAHLFSVYHNISYYAREMKAFQEAGVGPYWHAYLAYRSAPMGEVTAATITATFYNFAPEFVADAVPAVWARITPTEAIALRDSCLDEALRRALGPIAEEPELAEAAELSLDAIMTCPGGARPLFAAHAALPVPEEPYRRLWHAATLWREYRGDGHNMALASADIDGVECHVLLTAKGVGQREVIQKIRGWSTPQWDEAQARLNERGFLSATGELAPEGRQRRDDIEAETDRLAALPLQHLGAASARLIELLARPVGQLVESGAVPDRWPPPKRL